MPKASWLDRIRQRLAQPQRRAVRRRQRAAEKLEHRELLSVSALITNGQLRVLADGNEAVVVQVDPAGNGRVQVLIDGRAATTLAPTQASELRSISISAGQGDNLIDLNAVTSAAFSFVDPVTGNPLSIVVDAGNGNDTLFGSQDIEATLNGGDGNDSINVGPANPITIGQVLNGNDGDDNIAGGSDADTISGGDGFDVINGGGGDDSIRSGDGDDTIFGGAGNDEIHGDHGEDLINGDAGDDTIFGESGDDTIIGDAGNDSILGGAGADDLRGDSGSATTTGNDTILGTGGNDTIRGNGGLDLLSGGDGDDNIGVTEASLSVSDVTVLEGNSGDIVTVTFLVNLTFEQADPVTVDAAVESISASIGNDVQAFSQTLVFAPGVTRIPVTVSIVSDDTQEQTETFRLRISNPVGAVITDNDGICTITDDDAPPPGSFTVGVQFSGGLTASQQAIFSQAAQRIEAIIIGDVPDITIPGIGLIDDIMIDASGVPIDGVNGILGQAGPTGLRSGSFLPYSGVMQFDTADLAALEASGQLIDTITHEMMHVLGFGTIWSNLGLIVGAGSVAPTFIGPQATAEYNVRFNQTGNSVPVEGSAAGPGSADGHWRETVFNNELMTPFINSGVNPVSRVTIAQFGDLGYQVNLGAADPYIVANSARLTAPSRLNGRILTLDREKVIGIPTDVSQVLPPTNWQSTAASRGSSSAALRAETVKDAKAAPQSPNVVAVVNTITFDELPAQPIDGLTLEGATFDFSVNGIPSSDATFNVPAPASFQTLSGSVVEGNAGGILAVDFTSPQSQVSFNAARDTPAVIANAATVTYFDAIGTLLGTATLSMAPSPTGVSEGQLSIIGQRISRVVIDFSVSNFGTRFALDNLRTDDAGVVAPATGSATIIGGNGNDFLAGGSQGDSIIGGAGQDLIAGGSGNDTLLGGGGMDIVFGGDGDDVVLGQGASDSLSGGAGNDLVNGGDGADVIVGDDLLDLLTGNDTLIGAAGDDLIAGGNGNDLLYGGAGTDSLSGGAGNDTLYGQGGSDILIGDAGDDTIDWRGEGNDIADVGDGQDSLVYRGTAVQDIISVGQSGSNLTLTVATAVLTLIGPDEVVASPVEAIIFDMLGGNDRVTIKDVNNVGASAIVVNGGTGVDRISAAGARLGLVRLVINGDDGDDSLIGSEGVDEINGGAGDDTINGGADDDIINGNADDDVIDAGTGNDFVDGGSGVDVITGGDGDDLLIGNTERDLLNGNAGNDSVSGGDDDDILIGEAGNDLLLGDVGKDTITGGSGDDTLDGGRNDDQLNGNSGNDKLRGDHGNDLIAGSDGADTIDGGDGNDTISGGTGNDGIFAGDGNDSVTGGDGDDTLVGSDGADTLLGGAGQDILLGGDGNDVVNGNGGTDTISLGEGTNINNDATAIIDESFVLTPGILLNLDASN